MDRMLEEKIVIKHEEFDYQSRDLVKEISRKEHEKLLMFSRTLKPMGFKYDNYLCDNVVNIKARR